MTYIEVISFDRRGARIDCAEAECDAALTAARTLWDDSRHVAAVGFYSPQEEGGEPKLVRMIDRRP